LFVVVLLSDFKQLALSRCFHESFAARTEDVSLQKIQFMLQRFNPPLLLLDRFSLLIADALPLKGLLQLALLIDNQLVAGCQIIR
jgi:hypothetical protein